MTVREGASGVSADAGGPAFNLFVIAMIAAALLLPRRGALAAGAAAAALHALGRLLGAGHSWLDLADELVAVGCTALALGVLIDALRRLTTSLDEAEAFQSATAAYLAERSRQLHHDARTRRLLHDEVLSTLALAAARPTAPTRAVHEAAAHALATLSAHGHRPGSASFDRDGVHVDHPSFQALSDLPEPVVDAMTAAAAEAVRNALRHSGATVITVRAHRTSDHETVLEVRDDGRGFHPTADAAFGVNSSIRDRVRGVGGVAEIHSAPGDGCLVRLRWSSRQLTPLPQPPSAPSRPAPSRRVIAWFGVAHACGNTWLALRHLDHPGSLRVSLACVALAWLLLALAVRRARLAPTSTLAVTLPFALALLTVGLADAGSGSLATFDSWIVGLATAPLLVCGVYASMSAGVAAGLVYSAVVASWAAADPGIAVTGALGVIAQPLAQMTGLALVGRYARGLSSSVERAEDDTASQIAAQLRHGEPLALPELPDGLDGRLHALLDRLRRLADGPDDQLLGEIRLVSGEIRDALTAPGALTPSARERLRRVREAGATVTLRGSGRPVVAGDRVSQVLARLPATDGSITVTLPDADRPVLRVVLVPAVPADLLPELSALAATVDGEFYHDTDATELSVDFS
ncbi:MAG: hypothetical protein QM621_10120 [Aeromicrobium sp.]|uniref:sensor histidine kinase n=1 Tax=Aeromicrobium sp. TaxID=1871063 RepID=UPI0039E33CA0